MKRSPTRRHRPSRRLPKQTAVCVLSCLLPITLAACGSNDSTSTPAGVSSVEADASAVQELVNKALLSDQITFDSLDPTVQDAFEHAAQPLSEDQIELALKCWKEEGCTVGDGPITLGIADGFGGNQWRQFTHMEAILQALSYPDIGTIIVTDAAGDLAKMQANVRSLVAQGATAIITYNDFGAAAAPAFAYAQEHGAKVSAYVGEVPDTPTSSIANQVHVDLCQLGHDMAGALEGEGISSGSIALLNGTPGNPLGAAWNSCLEDVLDGTGVSVGSTLDTNWTPEGTFKAASALAGEGDSYAAVVNDYADTMVQVVEAYTQAQQKIPMLVTSTSNNGLLKTWKEKQGTEAAFPLYYASGITWQARVSVTAVMRLLAGQDVAPEINTPLPFIKARSEDYKADRPDSYPGPSVLVPDVVLNQMLGG